MDSVQTFRITLTGGYRAGTTPEVANKQFATLTGSNMDKIRLIMKRTPVVVKRGLDEATALRYRQAIERTGMVCQVESEIDESRLQTCPMCGVRQSEERIDCSACGIVFHKYRPSVATEEDEQPPEEQESDECTVRLVSKEGWKSLMLGVAGAGIVLLLPFINVVMSAFSTLVHEFGHSVFAWMFAYPSFPAFDFVYGGGVAVHFDRRELFLWLIYAAFLWLVFRFGRTPLALMVIAGAIAVYSILAFTPAHRTLMIFMGHGMELVFSGLFLFRAMSGHATFHNLERVLYAFVGFYLQFRAAQFALEFFNDPGFREFYKIGKRGITNDFQKIAWMLNVELTSVFGVFLLCAIFPPFIAWLVYRYEPFWFPPLRRIISKD